MPLHKYKIQGYVKGRLSIRQLSNKKTSKNYVNKVRLKGNVNKTIQKNDKRHMIPALSIHFLQYSHITASCLL